MRYQNLLKMLATTGFCIIAFAGCGGGSNYSSTVIPITSTALRGTALVPTGVATSRTATSRSGSAVSEIVLPGAQVKVGRLLKNGTLEEIDGLTSVTDASGKYTISGVPAGENFVVTASKLVSENGNNITIIVQGFVTVDTFDIAAGGKENVTLNSASTLTVEMVKDIIATVNAGKMEDQQIDASRVPHEVVDALQTEVVSALNEESRNTVDVSQIVKGDSGARDQLKLLENSAGGDVLSDMKANASTKGSLRVKVVQKGDSGEEDEINGTKLKDAKVVLTIDGIVSSGITDADGEAFFSDLETGKTVGIEIAAEGYAILRTTSVIDYAGIANDVVVFVEKITENQKPISKAGPDQTVLEGTVITLDGSSSFDPDGDTITYIWNQIDGATQTLSSVSVEKLTFTPSADGVFIFSLIVSDGSISSDADEVVITVDNVVCVVASDCEDSDALTVDSCTNGGTTTAACVNVAIECNVDDDCDDSDDLTDDMCENGGTISASCSNTSCVACTSNNYCAIKENDYGHVWMSCANAGTCDAVCITRGDSCELQTLYNPYSNIIECSTDSYCDDGDSTTMDICENKGVCGAVCVNEVCTNECTSDAECDDNNALTIDTCEDVHTCSKECVHTACTPVCVQDMDCPASTPFSTEVCDNPNTCNASCRTL